VQECGGGGDGQDAGGGVRGAAEPGVGVVAGLERGGGPAERGHRVTAAGIAEQRVEGHPGGEAGGERPTTRAAHQAIVPGPVLGPSAERGWGGWPMCSARPAGRLGSMRTYAELPGLMTVMTGDEKHGPSATSTLDVLWVLYDQVLRVSPDRLEDPGRDRFLLSKGHGPAAYYAVLAAKGFIPESWLAGFGSAGSALGYHPDRNLVPGVEIGSGSLGHGLPLGVGLAHGLIARGLGTPRVFVLVGDAELDEGSNNEAIVYAGAVGLANLVVVAVDNQSSSYGWGAGGIEAHFAVSGWSVARVSGRDHAALSSALSGLSVSGPGPRLVVASVEGSHE
jgi:transketolase